MIAVIVRVLPVPGPPVTTESALVRAADTASNWRSLSPCASLTWESTRITWTGLKVFNSARARRTMFRRSEERRVGKECVSTCRSRRSPCHENKNKPPYHHHHPPTLSQQNNSPH